MIRNKKAQVYGLSAFIYALAIAIILIVGLLGLSKEYDLKSTAGLYRFSTVVASKNGEIVKKLMDQERGYAVDKSLYITGAFGGYSPDVDLICNTSSSGCDSKCTSPDCYPNVNDSNGDTCGVIANSISYMGEKYVPRWRAGDTICTPSLSTMINRTFYEYAGEKYVNPAAPLIAGLSAATHTDVKIWYKLQINGLNESTGSLETSWFTNPALPDNEIKIASPAPPDNPVVEYSFAPFVHLFSNTSFFNIYKESKDFVDNNEFSKILKNESSPVPTVVDEDFLVAKMDASGAIRNCTTDPYPSAYCDMNSSEVPHPFRALVNYSATLPNTPNACDMPRESDVNRTYPHHCVVQTKRDSTGQLIVTGFADYCADDNTKDGAAMRCIMDRTINNIVAKLNLGANAGDAITPHNTTLGWKYELNSFNLTFKGAPTVTDVESGTTAPESDYMSYYVYNTTDTTPTSTCKSSCTDAKCVGTEYRYCSDFINITGNVTTTLGKYDVPSCPTRTSGDAGAIISVEAVAPQAQINCQTMVNVTASAENVGLGGISRFYQLLLLRGETPNYTNFTISEEQVSLINTRAIFNLSIGHLYPGNFWSEVGGTTNLSYCEEQTRSYTAFILQEPGGLHRGGFNCTQNSDCASGLGCSNNNVCIPCGANGDWPDSPDQHCCIGSVCDSGGTCRDDWCYTCGAQDKPCCSTGDACSSSLACNDTIASNAGFCKKCGNIGQSCCVGDTCSIGTCNTTTHKCVATVVINPGSNPCPPGETYKNGICTGGGGGAGG